MNPRLLFHNVYALGTPSSSPAAASGYPATNVSDWRAGAAFAWRAGSATNPTTLSVTVGSTTVDTLFIAGHNLGSQTSSITISLTSPATRTNFFTVPNTWGSRYIMAGFSAASGTTFTLSFGGTFATAAQAAVVVLGQALELPWGMQPGHDVKSFAPSREDAISDTGLPLGGYFTSVKKSVSLSWPEPGFTTSEFWTKAFPNFDTDFRDHATRNPFAFGYDLDVDNDGMLCRLTSAGSAFGWVNTRRVLTLDMMVHEPR